MPESDPNKHPSRRYRALKPSGYEPESYEEYYGADEQAELWDIMQGVRPEDRFSGEFGLLPYLGYYGSGDPDDPAYGVSSINKYDIKNPEDLSQSKLVGADWPPGKLRRVPESGPIGFYNPLDLPFEYTGIEDIQYLEGSEYPSPGPSGVSAFYPQADFLPLTPEEQSTRLYTRGSPFLSSEEMRTGKVDLGEGSPHEAYVGNKAFPGIAVHELMHRGFHTEAVKDFSKEFNLDNAVMANDFFISPRTGAMDSYFQHMLIDSRDWEDAVYDEAKDPAAITEPYRNVLETFQDQFLEWLTPEKQAQYGIDLPDSEKLKAMGYQGGGPVSNAKSDFLDKLGSHRTDIMSRMREIDEMVPPDSPEFRLNHITAQNLDLTLTMLDKIADDSAESPRYMTEAIDLVSQSLDDYLTLPFNAGGAEAINELMELIRHRTPFHPSSGAQRGPYLYDRFRALQTGTDRIYSDETGYKLGETPRETNVQQYKDLPYPEDDPTRDYELNRALLERARWEPVSEWDRPGSLGGASMPGRHPEANLVFEQLRRWDPYAAVTPEERGLTVEDDLNRRNRILNRAGGGFIDKLGSSYLLPDPVHLAAGGTGTNIFDNPAFTPTVKTAVPFFSITTQGYFDDIGGISKAQAYAMNKAIEEGLAALTEKNPNNWTQDDIDRFNLAVENNLLAVASQYPDDAALQKIATAIQQRRDREWTTLEQKWETWNDFVDNYEASDDLNADIQDVAEKAIEIFGYGTDEGKEAFLMAAAKYGVTNEQIAEAMGTTVDAILGNLPDFNPISYAKEAVSKVWDWIKDAQGKCLVGLDGTLNCNWQHAGGPPIGGTTSGAPVWKIPGTNTTVGVDLGNEIYNVIFGRLTCALHQQDCPKLQDLPSLIFGDILREIERLIRGGLEEKVREKILRAMMDQIDDTDGSFGLGLNLEKYCYNEDGSIHSQVLVGQSCPINTSEEPPEGTPITQDGPCKDADGNIRKDVDGNDLYPDINGVCPTTTTITEVVCYSDTDGSTVAALADGTCPMGSSTTAPGPETLCTQSGGTWENGACVCPAKSKLENGQCMADAINVDAQKDECEAAGNTWDDVQKKCYSGDQTVIAAQTKCTESGGTWDNGVCNCGNDPTIELVDGQCVVKDGSFRTPEEVCVTNRDGTATGNTWENGRCVGPATVDDRSDKQKCEDNGNTWNEATNTCITAGGVVNDDDAEEQCKTQGGNYYWNRNNQTCVNRCPGGGTYNADKDACETTVSDDDPDDPEYTTCSGITDYNQQPVNGVYPTVTRNYLAAEFAEIGGVCPAHFGPPPGGNGGDNGDGGDGTLEDCQQWSWDTKQFEVVPRDENGECPTGYGGTPPKDWSGTPCDIPNSQPTKEGGCECAPGYVATVSEDGTLTACVSDWKGKCEFDGAYWDDQSETCDCMGGYEPVYTDGVLTACTKKDPGCPTNGEINELGECVCKEGFTPGYTDGVLTSCTKGKDVGDDDNGNGENGDNGNGENGDACPANSTRNDDGVCVCNTGYSPSTDSDGVMTCSLDYPANNCSNPAYAATHVAECGNCDDKEYAEANPQICGITDGDPYTRPYATFEGVDMVRPPWVTPPDVRIDRYPETEPSTYSTLPAPAGSYEYGISSLARRPQDIREAVSVIDPGYEQLRGGPPAFTTEEVSPEEQARRQAATDRYYGAMGRLSDYSTDFNIGVDELSESLGIPRTNFYEAPADGGFSIHDPNFTYATPTYGTPPEGYPTSPDILAAADRPFSSPWLEEEEVEEESMFAHGGAVDEEPQGLESLLQRRQNAVNSMFVKRGRGNGVR